LKRSRVPLPTFSGPNAAAATRTTPGEGATSAASTSWKRYRKGGHDPTCLGWGANETRSRPPPRRGPEKPHRAPLPCPAVRQATAYRRWDPQISDRRRTRCLSAVSRDGRPPGANTVHDPGICRLPALRGLGADRRAGRPRRRRAGVQAAGLEGVPASPKGLRHGFGVAAVTAGIPLNLVQKWLGRHAQLSTTAVYANAVGAEEKDVARRMWVKASGRHT
jgi:hypothetical protein